MATTTNIPTLGLLARDARARAASAAKHPATPRKRSRLVAWTRRLVAAVALMFAVLGVGGGTAQAWPWDAIDNMAAYIVNVCGPENVPDLNNGTGIDNSLGLNESRPAASTKTVVPGDGGPAGRSEFSIDRVNQAYSGKLPAKPTYERYGFSTLSWTNYGAGCFATQRYFTDVSSGILMLFVHLPVMLGMAILQLALDPNNIVAQMWGAIISPMLVPFAMIWKPFALFIAPLGVLIVFLATRGNPAKVVKSMVWALVSIGLIMWMGQTNEAATKLFGWASKSVTAVTSSAAQAILSSPTARPDPGNPPPSGTAELVNKVNGALWYGIPYHTWLIGEIGPDAADATLKAEAQGQVAWGQAILNGMFVSPNPEDPASRGVLEAIQEWNKMSYAPEGEETKTEAWTKYGYYEKIPFLQNVRIMCGDNRGKGDASGEDEDNLWMYGGSCDAAKAKTTAMVPYFQGMKFNERLLAALTGYVGAAAVVGVILLMSVYLLVQQLFFYLLLLFGPALLTIGTVRPAFTRRYGERLVATVVKQIAAVVGVLFVSQSMSTLMVIDGIPWVLRPFAAMFFFIVTVMFMFMLRPLVKAAIKNDVSGVDRFIDSPKKVAAAGGKVALAAGAVVATGGIAPAATALRTGGLALRGTSVGRGMHSASRALRGVGAIRETMNNRNTAAAVRDQGIDTMVAGASGKKYLDQLREQNPAYVNEDGTLTKEGRKQAGKDFDKIVASQEQSSRVAREQSRKTAAFFDHHLKENGTFHELDPRHPDNKDARRQELADAEERTRKEQFEGGTQPPTEVPGNVPPTEVPGGPTPKPGEVPGPTSGSGDPGATPDIVGGDKVPAMAGIAGVGEGSVVGNRWLQAEKAQQAKFAKTYAQTGQYHPADPRHPSNVKAGDAPLDPSQRPAFFAEHLARTGEYHRQDPRHAMYLPTKAPGGQPTENEMLLFAAAHSATNGGKEHPFVAAGVGKGSEYELPAVTTPAMAESADPALAAAIGEGMANKFKAPEYAVAQMTSGTTVATGDEVLKRMGMTRAEAVANPAALLSSEAAYAQIPAASMDPRHPATESLMRLGVLSVAGGTEEEQVAATEAASAAIATYGVPGWVAGGVGSIGEVASEYSAEEFIAGMPVITAATTPADRADAAARMHKAAMALPAGHTARPQVQAYVDALASGHDVATLDTIKEQAITAVAMGRVESAQPEMAMAAVGAPFTVHDAVGGTDTSAAAPAALSAPPASGQVPPAAVGGGDGYGADLSTQAAPTAFVGAQEAPTGGGSTPESAITGSATEALPQPPTNGSSAPSNGATPVNGSAAPVLVPAPALGGDDSMPAQSASLPAPPADGSGEAVPSAVGGGEAVPSAVGAETAPVDTLDVAPDSNAPERTYDSSQQSAAIPAAGPVPAQPDAVRVESGAAVPGPVLSGGGDSQPTQGGFVALPDSGQSAPAQSATPAVGPVPDQSDAAPAAAAAAPVADPVLDGGDDDQPAQGGFVALPDSGQSTPAESLTAAETTEASDGGYVAARETGAAPSAGMPSEAVAGPASSGQVPFEGGRVEEAGTLSEDGPQYVQRPVDESTGDVAAAIGIDAGQSGAGVAAQEAPERRVDGGGVPVERQPLPAEQAPLGVPAGVDAASDDGGSAWAGSSPDLSADDAGSSIAPAAAGGAFVANRGADEQGWAGDANEAQPAALPDGPPQFVTPPDRGADSGWTDTVTETGQSAEPSMLPGEPTPSAASGRSESTAPAVIDTPAAGDRNGGEGWAAAPEQPTVDTGAAMSPPPVTAASSDRGDDTGWAGTPEQPAQVDSDAAYTAQSGPAVERETWTEQPAQVDSDAAYTGQSAPAVERETWTEQPAAAEQQPVEVGPAPSAQAGDDGGYGWADSHAARDSGSAEQEPFREPSTGDLPAAEPVFSGSEREASPSAGSAAAASVSERQAPEDGADLEPQPHPSGYADDRVPTAEAGPSDRYVEPVDATPTHAGRSDDTYMGAAATGSDDTGSSWVSSSSADDPIVAVVETGGGQVSEPWAEPDGGEREVVIDRDSLRDALNDLRREGAFGAVETPAPAAASEERSWAEPEPYAGPGREDGASRDDGPRAGEQREARVVETRVEQAPAVPDDVVEAPRSERAEAEVEDAPFSVLEALRRRRSPFTRPGEADTDSGDGDGQEGR